MEITKRFKNALTAFTKTNNGGPDPNSFLRYGSRRMPSTWSTPEISDEDFYTGLGFAVVNKLNGALLPTEFLAVRESLK